MTKFVKLFLLLIFCVSYSFQKKFVFDSFHKGSGAACNVAERIKHKCSVEKPGVRSYVECVTECLHFADCNGASFDKGTCVLHKDCPYVYQCSMAAASPSYFQRHCLHGTWNAKRQLCKCPTGFSGARCEIYPRGCKREKSGKDKRIIIDPEQTGENPFPVTCVGSEARVAVLRNKGRGNFNRTWKEYRRGFYEDNFHQWLGLDAWHRLSKYGCKKVRNRFVLNKNGQDKPFTFRTYEKFVLLDESNKYKFSCEGGSLESQRMPGNYKMPYCFAGHKQTPFSTWDRDNDKDAGKNCAARAGIGWWYSRGCDSNCQLLGVRPEDWSSRPSHPHLRLKGANLANMLLKNSYVEIYLVSCSG